MIDEEYQLDLASQLLVRLERLSADSYWAHRASGIRGALLRCVEQIEDSRVKNLPVNKDSWQKLNYLYSSGFAILEKAAREIRVQDRDLG